MRQDSNRLRSWLLEMTPLGTDISEVSVFRKSYGWNDDGHHERIPPPAKEPFLGGDIGEYQGWPWYVFVRAFWEFDADGRLTDIKIEKTYDSP